MSGGAPLRIDGLRRPGFGPFDLTLQAGECCVVTGPSGAGKTVFLRMIADLDPNEGKVWLAGEEREGMPATRWRRLVTYVPAESGWWADTVQEHFQEHFSEAAQAAPDFARIQLPEAAFTWPVARLSTGERQRLALLRAVVQRPRALLLDEPTSALDPGTTECVERLLKELMRDGVILIVVSHQPEQAARLATCRLQISAGRPGTVTP